MLALGSLLGKIIGEGLVPGADVFGSVVKSVSKILRASLFHTCITVVELPRLVCRERHSGKNQNLVGSRKV